jgi:PIN domain nuclease of toxin-antitoxin system
MMLLDTSAVLGYLNDEPGKEIIESALLTGQACIGTVNQTEVISKLLDWGLSFDEAVQALNKLALAIELFSTETALETARLRALTRQHGLSLGDRACLATARLRQHTVLTGDREWLKVADALGLNIISFRPIAH